MILDEPAPMRTSQSEASKERTGNRRTADEALDMLRSLSTTELIRMQAEIDGLLKRDLLSLLPPEVSLVILSYLSFDDLVRCHAVSRSWNRLANDQAVWKALCDLEGVSYHAALPASVVRRRQQECGLRRSSPRVTLEPGDDEGWDQDDVTDGARWTVEAGNILEPWTAGGQADVRMASPGPSFPSSPHPLPGMPALLPVRFAAPVFTGTSSPNRHSSPATLQSLTTNSSGLSSSPAHRPSTSLLPSSYADPSDKSTDAAHVPNFRHLFVTSRILKSRPSAKDTFHPTLQTLSPPLPSSAPPHPFPYPPPQAAYSCLLWKRAWALVSSRDRSIRIWDLSVRGSERVVGILEHVHEGSVLSLSVGEGEGEHGVRVVSAGSDGRLVVWWVDGTDAGGAPAGTDGRMVQTRVEATIAAHTSSVLCVRSDRKRIVSCSKDRTIRTFSATTFEPLLEMDGHRAAVNAVSLVDDRIVSASGDRTIRLWCATTGAPLAVLEAHLRGVASIDFDGRFVISGSSDSQVRLFDLDDPSHPGITYGPDACAQGDPGTHDVRCVCNCARRGHTDLVRTLQMGKHFVVSGSYDKSVLIWDRKTHALVRELSVGHNQRVFCVAFDETKVVSVGQDGRLVIHRFDDDLDTSFLKL